MARYYYTKCQTKRLQWKVNHIVLLLVLAINITLHRLKVVTYIKFLYC